MNTNRRKNVLLSSAIALGLFTQAATAQDSAIDKVTPVTDEMLLNPPDGDWLMWRRTYNGWGYSPLDQINKENVGELRLAWSWTMTPGRTQETPLVHDGVIYIQNSDAVIQALDGATGDLIWEYEYDLPDDAAIRGVRNKAIYEDKLIIATRHAHLVALDTKTGDLIWDKTVANYEHGYGFSSGPIVANGVIIQGMTGCSNAQPGGSFSNRAFGSSSFHRFVSVLWDQVSHPGQASLRSHCWSGSVGSLHACVGSVAERPA